ncbi:glycosyltransferase family 4 protein [Methanobacterium sp.]|uniref:glycosyltransferase family 4 protein n=1 Tax=Methanobacterium sp. TaxID=2164 RepID=UPI0031594BDE
MKICLISNLYPPCILGGAEVVVEKVAKNLAIKGHEVVVITTSYDEETVENVNGVKVYRVNPLNVYKMYDHPKKPSFMKPIWHTIDLWNIQVYKTLKSILEDENPDIVHIHNFKGFSLSAFQVVKKLNLPLVFTAHDYSLICMRANLLNSSGNICDAPSALCSVYNKIQKNLVDNKPDVVIAPSKFVIDKLKSEGLFKNIEAVKVPLGIEIGDKQEDKDYGTIDILYAGALSEHKGVHILINAFKNLKYENITLHIVGKGNDESKFKQIAKDDNRIIFHGFKTGKDLINFYKSANISVVPSIWYDNSPMVIYESLMCGTPVIGSRIGGIPELIENGYNGFLFETGNIGELEKILECVIENPSKLKELEDGALKSVQKYSMENHINKLIEIYESLILVN